MNKHDKMLERIKNHGDKLKRIFDVSEDSIILCKKLRMLEIKGRDSSLANNNGIIGSAEWVRISEAILKTLDKTLHYREKGIPVICNGDSRGYYLKIEAEYMSGNTIDLFTDLGGYGIIAPNLTE